jgi:hypothetical protein
MKRTLILAMAVLCAVALVTTVNAEIIQPGPVEGLDAYVYKSTDAGGAYAGYNYGNNTDLHLRGDSYNRRQAHSFIEFDVSGLAQEVATVQFSLLSHTYYGNASGSREIILYEVTEDWIEGVGQQPATDGSITYNNQPAVNMTPVASIIVPSSISSAEAAAGGIWHVWDSEDTGNAGLATLVEKWRADSSTNHGMMIQYINPTSTSGRPYQRYHSSDYGALEGEDPSLRPKLDVTLIPEPGCVVMLLCGMTSLLFLAWRRR